MTAILVVEDEAIVARDLQATLNRLGYTVPSISAYGEDALDKAEELLPDLVLMDINLKGRMDGIETAAVLRRRMNLPVIFLTAYSDDNTIQRASTSEPYGYLLKPFSERELKSAIEIALFKHTAEGRLRERARRVENALEALGEAVISADLQGRILLMNAAAAELTGWSVAEAIGQPLGQVCCLERKLDGSTLLEATGAKSREPTTCSLRSRHGRQLLVEHSVSSIVDDDETVMGIVVALRDVTEQRCALEQVALGERLGSIAALVGGISHEINNPLAYVVANIDFAREDLAALEGWWPRSDSSAHASEKGLDRKPLPSEKLQPIWSSLAQAAEGAQRIRRVVADLNSFSHPSTAGRTEMNLAAVLASAVVLARPIIEERSRLHVKIGELPELRGSETRLVQAFTGLLIGAAAAFPRANVEEHEVRLEAYTDDLRRPVVVVSDNGPVMDSEELRHLFEPFYARSGAPMGSGLGLWICHRVLSEHGARIQVTNNGERGNRYVVLMEHRKTARVQEN